ncbi:hypothetical protein [Aciduliprofundum sp. MAR08-339]|uniref:hypothetical protein n=1 Tax=Aciduliprofundum sp. (strain MAR08-339) TaxID=673860 RepID=UPI0030808C60
MPRGGRYLYSPPLGFRFAGIYSLIDLVILVLVIIILIHLFIVASFYVIALVGLLLLREFVRPRYGRRW